MKINKKDIKLKNYGISRYRYLELRYFCLQYMEKKQSGEVKYEKDIKLIDETVKEIAGSLQQYLMENVTEGVRYEDMQVPCGRRQFYELRRLFFVSLSWKIGN